MDGGGNAPRKGADGMKEYVYGMRLRGFSPGCQPMEGLRERRDGGAKYYDLLVYDRKLTDKEMRDYELDFVGKN